MKLKTFARTLAAAMAVCTAAMPVQAQFSVKGIVKQAKHDAQKKVSRTIEDKAREGINSAVNDAERRATNAVTGLKQDEYDHPDYVEVKTKDQPYDKYTIYRSKKLVSPTDYSQIAANYLYYMLRTKQAAAKGKDDEMCTDYYEMTKLNKMLSECAKTYGDDLNLLSGDMQNENVAVIKMVYKAMYADKGFPSDANGKTTDGLYKKLNWVVDKALKSKSQGVRRFYYDFAYPNYVMACGQLINDSDKKVKKLLDGLTKMYETTADYRTAADYEPQMPSGEVARNEKIKAEFEAKAAAEKKAQEEREAAERESNSRPMPKPGMKNASLAAQCLKLAKADYPDWNPTQAIIKSRNWQIDRQYGSIVRRRITVYLICNDGGQKVARAVSYQQPYMGGGRYGSLQYFGVGTESFYIK